jgi:hypothetical protein
MGSTQPPGYCPDGSKNAWNLTKAVENPVNSGWLRASVFMAIQGSVRFRLQQLPEQFRYGWRGLNPPDTS